MTAITVRSQDELDAALADLAIIKIIIDSPRECRARGVLGCWLVLAERDTTGHILGVQAVPVDGETIRANTPYVLRGGQIVEAEA